MTESYRRLLGRVLVARHWVVLTVVVIAALGGGLLMLLPSELSPLEDRGYVVTVQI